MTRERKARLARLAASRAPYEGFVVVDCGGRKFKATPDEGISRGPVGSLRNKVLSDPCVRRLTREVLRAAESRDLVDRVSDVELALRVLRDDMRRALGVVS